MTIPEMKSLQPQSEVIYLEDGQRFRCRVLGVEIRPNGTTPEDWLGIQLEVLKQEQSNGVYKDAEPGERFEAGLCISVGGAYCGWSLYPVPPVEARCMAVTGTSWQPEVVRRLGNPICGWQGTVADINGPCPKCGERKLAPVAQEPK